MLLLKNFTLGITVQQPLCYYPTYCFRIKVKILSGDHKDGTGVLINIDGIDGIIKMDTSDVLIILELKLLAKYIPTD